MLAYATLGTDDLPRARRFYDAVLAPLGIRCDRTWPEDGVARYRDGQGGPPLFLNRPFNGGPASAGNGAMLALTAADEAAVQAAHAAALAHGGTDEGAPGHRPQYGVFYGAYARDPDGNKLCFVVQPEFMPGDMEG